MAKNISIGYHNTYWFYTALYYIKQQIYIRMNLPGMSFMPSYTDHRKYVWLPARTTNM